MCRSSRGLVLSLVTRESRSLFPAAWQPKDCLIVPGRALPTRLKRVLVEVSFPTDKNLRLQGVMFTAIVSWEHAVRGWFYYTGHSQQQQ